MLFIKRKDEPAGGAIPPESAQTVTRIGEIEVLEAEPRLEEPLPRAPVVDVVEAQPLSLSDLPGASEIFSEERREKPPAAKKASFLSRLSFSSLRPKKPASAKKSRGANPAEKASKAAPPSEAPVTAKARKSSQKNNSKSVRQTRIPAEIQLAVELENGFVTYWAVGASYVRALQEPARVRTASFSPKDHTFYSGKPLSAKQAQDLALENTGEAVSVLNRTKNSGIVYASSLMRVREAKVPLGPGQLIAEQLRVKAGLESGEHMLGIHLTSQEIGQSLLILYKWSAEQGFSSLQVAVNPDNLDFTIQQFSDIHIVDASTLRLFTNEEFMAALSDFQTYPQHELFYGLPLDYLLQGAAVASLVFAVGAGAYFYAQYSRLTSLRAQSSSVQSQLSTLKKEQQELVQQHLLAFASRMAVNADKVFARADALWQPGSTVSLEATHGQQQYRLLMPITRQTSKEFSQAARQDAQALLSVTAPAGCRKSQLKVNGSLNALEIDIHCQNPDSALSRYWGGK